MVAAMGPESAYAALRSIATAGEYLGSERPRDELAVTVERGSAGKDPGGAELFELRLRVRLEPKAATEAEEREVRVAQATNIGRVASFVARAMGEKGGVPALRGMGAAAASQALKAVTIAQKYVRDERAEELVVTPRVVRVLGENQGARGDRDLTEGRKRSMEFVLRCRCVSLVDIAAGSGQVS